MVTRDLPKNPRLLVLASPRYGHCDSPACCRTQTVLKKPVSDVEDVEEEEAEVEEKPKKKAAPRKKPESKARGKAEPKPKARAAPKKAAKKVRFTSFDFVPSIDSQIERRVWRRLCRRSRSDR